MRVELRSVCPDGTCLPDEREMNEVRYHVLEVLDATCLAIKASRRREEFPALMDLLLAAKNAEEATGR